ncbi:hypothetical protein, partial [Stenotrophomonas muris]|uniref:hypothetical protein n=1 Tax=Stenotrophomonas muris TaxID=2963283 RepID=UPI002E786D79
WQRIACFKTINSCLIKRLQDGQSSFLQAPSQDTCAYFQRSGEVASAPFPCAAKFPSKRAAHYARLFQSVNTFVRSSRSAVVGTLLSLKPLGGGPCDGGGEVWPHPHRL